MISAIEENDSNRCRLRQVFSISPCWTVLTIVNTGDTTLKRIVVGERLNHDVGDYPDKRKRIYRNTGMKWDLVDLDSIEHPSGGQKE